jgi:hypothetical protein
MPNVPHEVPTAMNVEREHVFETDDVENERESKAPRLISHEDEDGPFMMEEGIIEAMEEYDASFEDVCVDWKLFDLTDEKVEQLRDRLNFPCNEMGPQRSAEQLFELDTVADELEISRLKYVPVPRPIDSC